MYILILIFLITFQIDIEENEIKLRNNSEEFFKIPFKIIWSSISIDGATANTNLTQILLQQKRALKTVFHLKRKETVKHIFSEFGILTDYGL